MENIKHYCFIIIQPSAVIFFILTIVNDFFQKQTIYTATSKESTVINTVKARFSTKIKYILCLALCRHARSCLAIRHFFYFTPFYYINIILAGNHVCNKLENISLNPR